MSQFEKRHYQTIAQVLQDTAPREGTAEVLEHHMSVIKEFADMFGRDNGNFKRDLFVRACVPGANVRKRT